MRSGHVASHFSFAWLAQSVERGTLYRGVVSSTRTMGGSFTRIITQSRHLNFINSQNLTELH